MIGSWATLPTKKANSQYYRLFNLLIIYLLWVNVCVNLHFPNYGVLSIAVIGVDCRVILEGIMVIKAMVKAYIT